MEKRKDNKGRILQKGESQRKNLTYQYRYTNIYGSRITVYAPDLKTLREKEREILKSQLNGTAYSANKYTVIDIVEKYLATVASSLKESTLSQHEYGAQLIRNSYFSHRPIGGLKKSDCKIWLLERYEDGQGYTTIVKLYTLLKSACGMAVDDEIISSNPFDFKFSDVIRKPTTTQTRDALTDEQQANFLSFVANARDYCKYYDAFVVLLGTGLRISEFCGLTKHDINLAENYIDVNHQLLKRKVKLEDPSISAYYIAPPKSKSGNRKIPMTSSVQQSIRNILSNRRKIIPEIVVDGYTDFISITKSNNPVSGPFYEGIIRRIVIDYNNLHPKTPLPHITPHLLRHTFCTNMINAGVNPKCVQYIMGHSTVNVTLGVYTHTNFSAAARELEKMQESF